MHNDFITSVELPKRRTEIGYAQSIMLLGSCFSEHIGQLLASSKFSCDINPFGVLYNPVSIAEALTQILNKRIYRTGDPELIEYNGWHSLMHHSTFSATTNKACIDKINTRIRSAAQNIQNIDILFLTFGSAYVYRLRHNEMIVGNCHKLPERNFIRERLSVEDIIQTYTTLIKRLLELRPKLKLIFTVSPIRHKKDGLHGNQISKSTLLLAIEALTERFPQCCFYFPSYEIMIDELRDYRFYADDMMHPTPLAISYIWKRFGECYFSSQTKKVIKEWEEIRKGLEHRPFNPEAKQYEQFICQLVLRIKQLKEKYPNFEVEKELALCHTLLNK